MSSPPSLPDQSDPQPKKIVGCLGAFLIVAGLFVLVIVLSIFSSPSKQTESQSSSSPSAANTAALGSATSPESQEGPIAKLDYTFDDIEGYGTTETEMRTRDAKIADYSGEIADAVYKITSTRSQVTKIVIRINCRFPAETNVTDYYGHEHSRPAETTFAKEIVVDDTDNVRRYTKNAYKEHQPFFSELYQDLVGAERQSPWDPPWPEEH